MFFYDIIEERLHDADSDVRRSVIHELEGQDRSKSVPLLVGMLSDPVRGVQEAAADALRRLRGADTVAGILPLLREEDIGIRNFAIDILNDIVLDGADQVIELLTDDDDDVRIFAATILATIKPDACTDDELRLLPDVGTALSKALRDANPNVRSVAAEGVGSIGYADAVPVLAEMLEGEREVLFEVVLALGTLGDERAVDPLLNLVAGSDDIIRYAAIDALAEIGSGSALKKLTELLAACDEGEISDTLVKAVVDIARRTGDDTPLAALNGDTAPKINRALRAGDPFIRRNAAAFAGLCGTAAEVPVLLDLLEDMDEATVAAAKEALVRLAGTYGDAFAGHAVEVAGRGNPFVCQYITEIVKGVSGALPVMPFMPALADEKSDIRLVALTVLAHKGGPEHEEQVGVLADDAVPEVRAAAAAALGSMGSRGVAGPLMQLLQDTEPEVQLAAIDALERLAERFPDTTGDIYGRLHGLINTDGEQTRRLVIRLLGRLMNRQMQNVLFHASKDVSPVVREEALGSIGTVYSDFREIILHCLLDESGQVRKRALLLLVQKQNPLVFEKLVSIVRSDPDMWVRYEGIKALGELKNKRAVMVLKELFYETDIKLLKAAVIEALEENGDYKTLFSLKPRENETDIQAAIEEALGRLKQEDHR